LTNKFISVVLPSLNEELSVGDTIKRVKEAFVKYNINGEILLIDASSSDRTVDIAKELGAKKAELVKYQTSGDASGDYSSVVGYAGIILK
jgi:AmmeMemoRadiSam system protein B